MDIVPIETRRALYYPFIHPRDANWVKATVLAFGQLSRIVPDGYALDDLPEVAELAGWPGPDGAPLVDTLSPRDPELWDAQDRLLRALVTVPTDRLADRFGFSATTKAGELEQPFHIHSGKLFRNLLSWLSEHQLTWSVDPSMMYPGTGRSHRRTADWFVVHPQLGRAIMSVIAIAAARDRGLNVVTDVELLHAAATALDEEEVTVSLIDGLRRHRPAVGLTQATDQLVHVVMTTGFDMSQLSVDDVVGLVCDGMDLRRFKAAVTQLARAVPADAAPHVRDARLRELSAEILKEWEQYSRGLTPRLKALLRQSSSEGARKTIEDLGKALTSVLAGTAAAHAGHWSFEASAMGLLVGVVVAGAGVLLKPQPKDPLRYLSKIEKAGATLVTAGIARAS